VWCSECQRRARHRPLINRSSSAGPDPLATALPISLAYMRASLQNLEPVGVHASALLTDRNFDGYRSSARYALQVEDVYDQGQPIALACKADTNTDATLSIAETSGVVRWTRDGIVLPGGEQVPIEAPALPPGTCRATLSVGGARSPISDVFIVTA
jgi:hypothetical protein